MDYQLNPTYDRQLGILNELSTAALQAKAYMARYGVEEDQFNKTAARLLRNAALNPNAIRSKADATAGDVLAATTSTSRCASWRATRSRTGHAR